MCQPSQAKLTTREPPNAVNRGLKTRSPTAPASARSSEKKIVARGRGAILKPVNRPMTRQQILDLYFLDTRCKLIDVAAFLDRVDRAPGDGDFRLDAFREAMRHLADKQPERAKTVLTAFSDLTTEPIPAATTKAACGAWPGALTGVAG